LLLLDYQDYLAFPKTYHDGLIVQQAAAQITDKLRVQQLVGQITNGLRVQQAAGQIQDRKEPKCFTLAPPQPHNPHPLRKSV
jgi:hypothetical protein